MTLKKKIIGISGHVVLDSTMRLYPNLEKVYVNHFVIMAVIKAGAIPIIIPMNENPKVIRKQMELLDGLIIMGGCDVNPLFYGEEPINKLGELFPANDVFDFELIRHADSLRIPLFGICRGMQIINVYYGGTLFQDNSLLENSYVKHCQQCQSDVATHTIDIESNSWIFSLLGSVHSVNSFHHQSIKKLATGFNITALAKDGIIEAIEKDGDVFCAGVQWHPETMINKYESMLSLFESFVSKCKESNR